MREIRWRVWHARREVACPAEALPFVEKLPGDLGQWLDTVDIVEGTPFLLSPLFEYDVELNGFFRGLRMASAARNTKNGYASDLARFLTFLWVNRGERSWRDATEDDHVAYLVWRRRDVEGPRVAGTTWDRDVAAVNEFYRWAVGRGLVATNPVPQRARRAMPVEAGRRRDGGEGSTPATYSHDAAGERMEWLPPVSYRRWRDVGLRGYGADGLADPRFRGRWAARNAGFADLMVRTGLRLTEQASLTVFEVPILRGLGGYQRFWLPAAIAKGGSARWVYVPESQVAELASYVSIDRAEVVARARAAGRYARVRSPLVVADAARPVVEVAGQFGSRHRVGVARLDPLERRDLFIDTGDGLEPAAFWLGEDGLALSVSTWKGMFADANARCRHHGVDIACHAHVLRHSFAVVTLEQLQRGHLAALGELTAEQRGQYVRVFGDPLDWVRRRLGHRSLSSTMIYLHALAELEMHTRMALVPDGWDDPRDTVVALDDDAPAGGG